MESHSITMMRKMIHDEEIEKIIGGFGGYYQYVDKEEALSEEGGATGRRNGAGASSSWESCGASGPWA